MEKAQEIYAYLMMHGPAMIAILLGLVSVATLIVSLTPSKSDDLAVERIGKVIRKIAEFFKVPNLKKGGGAHPKLAEKEAAKDEKK